jgi:hypothetical protein
LFFNQSLRTFVPLHPSRPGKPEKNKSFISSSLVHIDHLPSGPYNKKKYSIINEIKSIELLTLGPGRPGKPGWPK